MKKIPEYGNILKEREQKECKNKSAAYSTLQAAARARMRMEERYPGHVFTEYKCEFCTYFHCGHIRMHDKLLRGKIKK